MFHKKVIRNLFLILFVLSTVLFPSGMMQTSAFAAAVYGDVSGNGKVDSQDYSLMKKYLVGTISEMPATDWKIAGDLNTDNEINSKDISILKRYILGLIPSLPVNTAPASNTIAVSKDGTGAYSTIQAAVDSIPDNNTSWVTILVKNGLYNEHVFIDKSFVALIGEDRSSTRIEFLLDRAQWNTYTGVTNTGSGVINIGCTPPDASTKAMTKVNVTDVLIGNITVVNTAPTGTGTVYTHALRGENCN